ncbi:hypothetical protein ACGFNU_28715 [Spirillospora sp. NPDC048911]|uniref:hypothetical protein n=1 Tax=Spirillospora sp. NPDC048911 TaxID=3364527 RepID=UPI003714BB4E
MGTKKRPYIVHQRRGQGQQRVHGHARGPKVGETESGLDPAKLSAKPAELRRQLLAWTRSGGLAGPVEGDSAQLWAAASDVLFHPGGPVSPQVRAACYRVLADLPDVRSLGEVADARGRRGQGLTRAGAEGVGPGQYKLIIDLRGGLPLAEEMPGGPDGRPSTYFLVTGTGYTATAPGAN